MEKFLTKVEELLNEQLKKGYCGLILSIKKDELTEMAHSNGMSKVLFLSSFADAFNDEHTEYVSHWEKGVDNDYEIYVHPKVGINK